MAGGNDRLKGDVGTAEATAETKTLSEKLLARYYPNSRLSWSRAIVPLLIVCSLVLFATLHVVHPGPPDKITIATGATGSQYYLVAQQYQKLLKRSGITLTILETEGSLDNLNRMMAPRSHVDIALVQSGMQAEGDGSQIYSLGSVFLQPLMIFYRRAEPLQRLSELAGDRIAVGPEGSGTRSLALALLKANEIERNGSTRLLDLEGEAAKTALLKRRVEAIFLTGDSASPATILDMLHEPGVRLFDFPQADAYVRRFRYLTKVELPAGAFDLGENLPANPINLLAPTVDLLAHENLHPALSDLLVEAAMEVHGVPTLLQSAGQFPAPLAHDYPVSKDAARYYKSGKSFSYRHLPFWLASLLDRLVVVLVPVFLVVIPTLRYLPPLYNWRIKSRINRRYGQLMDLERQSLGDLSPAHRAALLDRLAQIEKSVIALKMPGSHADQLYVLRQHLQFVRNNLARAAERAMVPS